MSSKARTPLRWASAPGTLHTIHANQIAVAFTGAEYYLIFGEVEIPPTVEEGAPLDITPVVRIAIPPAAMPAIAQAIQQSLQHTEPTIGEEKP